MDIWDLLIVLVVVFGVFSYAQYVRMKSHDDYIKRHKAKHTKED